MREMKESGVEWIGEIDSTFQVSSIGTLFSIKKDIIGHEPDQVLSITQTGIRPKNTASNEGQNANSYAHYQIVNCGDFAMNHMDLLTGWVDISVYEGVTSPDYRVFTINDSSMVPEYFLRVFQYYYTNRVFFGFGQGVASLGRWRLPAQNFNSMAVPVPPIENQKSIADVIKAKSTQVDALITNVQKQIEKLKQYKQSLITEVVTKGLDPNVPMKDSGVEWIGEIPEHWSALKYGFCASVKSNLVDPAEYQDYQQISPDSIEKKSNRITTCKTVKESGVVSWNHLFYKGQIIYSKVRPLLSKVIIAPFDGLCSADMYPIETENNASFIVYLMLSSYFTDQVALVTQDRVKMPKINQDELSALFVVLPPLYEQGQIVDFLNEKCTQIDRLISIKQAKIEMLNAYKKSLIYEYVTGKKEVI